MKIHERFRNITNDYFNRNAQFELFKLAKYFLLNTQFILTFKFVSDFQNI